MNLTRVSISNPVAVIAAVLLVLLMGAIGLAKLPVQMIPDVQRPYIQITTGWRAAAPEEVESEIIEPQEDVLRGLPGLEKMESSASRGNASIDLMFSVETDLQRALLEVINRLNQVPRYPNDVTEPRIFAGQGSFGASIGWFILTNAEGNTRPMASYADFVREVVQARIERVPGIANSNAYGGRNNEVRITFDPYKASALGIEIPSLARLTGNNNDTSGGYSEVGRRQYALRYAGQYELPDFGDMVLDWRGGNPVLLRDIATVEVVMRDSTGFIVHNGHESIAFNAQVEKGVNVLEVMAALKEAVVELREGPLAKAGLEISQAYDESIYIKDSIAMLRTNLLIGIGLAIAILWWFMRKFRATLMVALAIPISLFTGFMVMQLTGRTLNMISLAGLAFATGMVLDAAIVVLENIIRIREEGTDARKAAITGCTQVWGALLASTATIATVEVVMRDSTGFIVHNGHESIAFNAQVEKGVNVLEVMAALKEAVVELREGPLAKAGLEISQAYDESIYIKDSIAMLRTNLLIGIGLAIAILWWFMRKFRATLMVALAIPISLFTGFMVMQLTGRTLNMISLAGLAFATGMVLDAAIVVLENIIRIREEGTDARKAAITGCTQVWGALLASTATTVVIFFPIMFLKDVSGQLFADLALVISVAVTASLIIAVTIIPTAASNWLKDTTLDDPHKTWWEKGTQTIMRITDKDKVRKSLIVGLFTGATFFTWLLIPPADYLPDGKQGFIFAFIIMPPGQSVSAGKEEFADVVIERLNPYLEDGADLQIRDYFMGMFGTFAFAGAMPKDASDSDAIVDTILEVGIQSFYHNVFYLALDSTGRLSPGWQTRLYFCVHNYAAGSKRKRR